MYSQGFPRKATSNDSGVARHACVYSIVSINQLINQSERPIVAELLLGKVRNEKKENEKNGYEKLIVCSV